jgi:hypothetical protein
MFPKIIYFKNGKCCWGISFMCSFLRSIVRFHTGGSMKLKHVSCISHTWFIYNLNTIFYLHNIYKEVPAPNPFLTSPFCCLEIPPLISWKLHLTYLEIPHLCRGANSCPLWSLVGCKPNACPLTTTLRYWLHIVQYKYECLLFLFS